MARKTKAMKQAEKAAHNAYKKHAMNVQFNVMDLGKVLGAAEQAFLNNECVDSAMQAAVTQYRVN